MGLKQKTSGSFLKSRARWIGRKIRVLREKKGMTQEDLAERAGLTQSHVSRLEDGKHSPSNVTLRKIAKALRVSVHKIDYEEHE
ncbi:MAG: helix-turn-helix transcriptional regulator [Planctomycetes bacterium]|nr:helix-turn-helix transcriptional regulator [Planctomycetota bacterium]